MYIIRHAYLAKKSSKILATLVFLGYVASSVTVTLPNESFSATIL